MSTDKRPYDVGEVSTSGKSVKRSMEADVLKRDLKTRVKRQDSQISREVILRLITWLEKT